MPAELRAVGLMLLISLAATAEDSPPPPDMNLIEFLGSIETQSSSGKDVLSVIDTALLPELPQEEPPHETK
jgi:hypothetical protein